MLNNTTNVKKPVVFSYANAAHKGQLYEDDYVNRTRAEEARIRQEANARNMKVLSSHIPDNINDIFLPYRRLHDNFVLLTTTQFVEHIRECTDDNFTNFDLGMLRSKNDLFKFITTQNDPVLILKECFQQRNVRMYNKSQAFCADNLQGFLTRSGLVTNSGGTY